MKKIVKTIPALFCGAILAAATASCGDNGESKATKVKETGLPKATATSTGAPKIAYVDVDSLMNQYEFCKEFAEILTKRSESYKKTISSREQQLQNAYIDFQQKAQQGSYTQEEGERAQQNLQRQAEELQKLQEDLTIKFDQEQQQYNDEMRDSIRNFLRDYNRDKGYSIILAKAGDNILYADPAMDITQDVINGLNKRYKKK